MGLKELPDSGPIGLDTAVFIYFIERLTAWIDVVRPIFQLAADKQRKLVTSELTLAEVLVIPYEQRDVFMAERYEALLSRGRGLSMIPVTRRNLRLSAQLRATYGLKTPDSIQIAAALEAQCSCFITNDRRLPEIAELRIIQLRDLVQAPAS